MLPAREAPDGDEGKWMAPCPIPGGGGTELGSKYDVLRTSSLVGLTMISDGVVLGVDMEYSALN